MAEAVETDVEDIYTQNMFVLEKELGAAAQTQENSLLLKFYSQMENLQMYYEEEKKQMKNNKTLR